MSPVLRSFALDLVESNMKDLYMRSKDGWCKEDKEEEMQDAGSRYLVTYDGEVPVGMIHFQFVEEETMTDRDADVAYCFEIQIVSGYQRRGIGEHLIKLLEKIGTSANMEKVMMTVFKANKDAIKFYIDKLQYRYDEISPSVCLSRVRASSFDYEILSKLWGSLFTKCRRAIVEQACWIDCQGQLDHQREAPVVNVNGSKGTDGQ
ncbi:N-alpha-acetyltransferase 40 [Mortierella sp. GBA43]|nr:N-alpha-acetyltransferase 40 [Mortierella sp. GBA43]